MKIQFKDFTLISDEKIILENENLTFEKGKYHLIGKNGIGKSSILNCLYRINDNYKGFIYINDIDIKTISTKKLRRNVIGYVNQKFVFFEYLSIKNNVLILIEDIEMQMKVLNEMVEEFGISENIKVNNLSGGQKQFLNLLLNMFNDKKILLIDEPFNNLSKNRMRKIDKFIKESDKLVLLISHKESDYKKVKFIQRKLILCEN